ncbi:hypothetical protein [Sphingobacterium siyangense]|uniref:hypothetical protein n=1 Tax=Sphingobacterium siyangense TaxID=459529 RepID=UPI003DA6B899
MNSLDTTGSLSSTPAQSTTATGTRPTTAVNQPAAYYSSQTSVAEGQQALTTTHPVTTTTLPLTKITLAEKWVALTPILLFVLILIFIFRKLRQDNVSLKDLLLDKDIVVEIEEERTKQILAFNQSSLIQSPDAVKAFEAFTNNSDPENEKNNTSVSRFLAFISGLVSTGVACTITTFFMWNYFDNGAKDLNLNELLTVLLSLGIGVIPYAFNKITKK